MGIMNLTHRESHIDPRPLESGAATPVRVVLRSTSYRLLPGHRLRLSVASSAWPVIWPSPEPATYGLHLGGESGCRLILPVLDANVEAGLEVPAFEPAPEGEPTPGSSEAEPEWRVIEDVISGSVIVTSSQSGSHVTPDGDTTFSEGERFEMTAVDADPAHARLHNEVECRVRGEGYDARAVAVGTTTSTASEFQMRVALEVTLDGEHFFDRVWEESIPRTLL
jgi:hypothetical protein